ncbi:MAG: ThuA domain-containing protein [Candidatus Omnitrophica bacterium]|nr:ThuA domain-containing protein [Candidatus Omnitrophota bacterium]
MNAHACRLISRLILFSTVIVTAGVVRAADLPAPAGSPKARVLIVTGQDYPGHPWKLTAPVLADLIRKDPRLEVKVVEAPKFLASPAMRDFDVIVLHFMNWEQPGPGPQAQENLREFVAGGKGLVLVHFACGAFQEWPEFRNLAGRSYDPKLRGHDPRGPFRVDITAVHHPITEGMQAFETDDELYTCLAGDRPIEVLATAKSKVDNKDYPIAFVLNYGKGRVFHCPLGHDVKAFAAPMVGELFRRGCAWAAGLPPVPPRSRAAK